MRLRQVVVGEVDGLKAVLLQVRGNLGRFAFLRGGDADKHVGLGRIAHAVVEFGDLPWGLLATKSGQIADQAAKAAKAAPLLGDGDGQQGFTFFAHAGALGHKAQAVEVHVGPTQNGHVGFATGFVACGVLLHRGHGHGARGLDDGAGVDEHVFDGGAHRIGVDHHVVVHPLLGQLEGFLSHGFHGGAIGKEAHVGQGDALMGLHRLPHGVGVAGLHANHLHLGAHRLDVGRHARDEAATAYGHEHRMQGALVLAQDFHGDGALARNHFRVVEGVDKSQPLGFRQGLCVLLGIRITLAFEHDFAAQSLDRLHLDAGGGDGHDDHRARAQALGTQGHALRVVARRGANDPLLELGWAEVGHFVVGPAQLEAEHRLLVFALEQDLVVQALAQVAGQVQVGFMGHVVDLGIEDALEVSRGVGRGGA